MELVLNQRRSGSDLPGLFYFMNLSIDILGELVYNFTEIVIWNFRKTFVD